MEDILISGKDNEIKTIKKQIKRKFNIKEMGEVNFVIGIKFERYKGGYFLHQKRYINDILRKYNIINNKQTRSLKPLENINLRNKDLTKQKIEAPLEVYSTLQFARVRIYCF